MALSRKVKRTVLCIVIFSIFILAIVLAVTLTSSKSNNVKTVYNGKGAVVANGLECAAIGGEVLKDGGSAADAVIATLFCEGVTCPQSMGLGGGFLAIIYDRANKKTEYLNARETAPANANQNMFVGQPELAVSGGLAVAVPGELIGYWELHQKYGNLPWKRLVQPTIELCKEGHIVTDYLHRVLVRAEAKILAEPSLREIYIDPKTNKTYAQGEKIKRLELAKSLEVIAKEGADALYSRQGSLFKNFVKDIQDFGGIVTEDDMLNYKTRWETIPSHPFMNDHQLFAGPLPGSGPLLTFIFDLLKEYKIDQSAESWHRVIEAFKFAYAERTQLGDPFFVDVDKILENLQSKQYLANIRKKINFDVTSNDTSYYGANYSQPEDHGTAHVSVIAANGDAISVTSTINYLLGASIRSRSTGIILNDEMDDFSIPGHVNAYGIPASPANYIQPGKRPLSSMTPLIVTDKDGNVKFIAGAAGGSKITLSLVNLMLQYFYFDSSLEKSVEARRIYHLLAPMLVQHEQGFEANVLNGLRGKGHGLEQNPVEFGFTAITAIANTTDGVTPVFDPRRGGSVSVVS